MQRPGIPEWFRGRSVFLTGGTGYMGKALLFKLLRSCPDLDIIFVLIRERRNETIQARIQSLLETEPFQQLEEEHPGRLKKIIPIKGDTCIKGLGLSPEDKKMIQEKVSVVFHMAANVRFDLPLKEAVRANVEGTLYVVSLAKQLPKLESFVHVSTAYSHCDVDFLEERLYPTPVDPESMVMTVNTMPEEAVAAMTKKLLGEQPNTYAFSKALGEVVVHESGLPVGIARPSIVSPSLKEPVTGWVESMNGPTGLMIGACKGVIRSVCGNGEYVANVIPCDLAVNAVIALAWKVGLDRPRTPIFCNVTQNKDNPISWFDAIEMGRQIIFQHPFDNMLWVPGGSLTKSKLKHWIRVALFQLLPAYILDALLYLTGNQPFLIRVQRKVQRSEKLLDYYIQKEWMFEDKRLKELEAEMSPRDRDTYPMDTGSICWRDYVATYIIGCKRYLKDDPSKLQRSRRIITALYYVDKIVKTLFFLLLAWLVYTFMTSYSGSSGSVVKDNDF